MSGVGVASKYMSSEFVEEIQKKINADQGWLAAAKGMKLTAKFGVDGKFLSVRIEDGKMSEPKESSPADKADASLDAKYEMWVRVYKGEITLQSAVMTGHIKFGGNIGALMRFQRAFTRLMQIWRSIPVEF